MFWVELALFLACILIGARIGGIGLGTIVAQAEAVEKRDVARTSSPQTSTATTKLAGKMPALQEKTNRSSRFFNSLGVSPAKPQRNYEICGRDVRTTLLFHFPVKEEDYVLG